MNSQLISILKEEPHIDGGGKFQNENVLQGCTDAKTEEQRRPLDGSNVKVNDTGSSLNDNTNSQNRTKHNPRKSNKRNVTSLLEPSRDDSKSGRSARSCSIAARAKKEAERRHFSTSKPSNKGAASTTAKTFVEDNMEYEDGSLKFYREPKKIAPLKRLPASVFSAELTHKFTESHSNGSNNRFMQLIDDSTGEVVREKGKIVRTRERIVHPIYGCHVAPFTVSDPEKPGGEPVYLVATTGDKWILIYTCTECSKLKLVQVYTDPGDDLYYTLKFTKFDNTPYLVASGKHGIVRLINVGDGKVEDTFNAAANVINEIQVHPKRPEIIALACKDLSVHLWNLKSRIQIAIFGSRGLEGHNDEILIVDFNEDATKLLSSGMDHFIIIWDLVGPKGVEKEIEMSYDESIKRESRPRLPVWRNFVFLKCSNVHRNYVDCARFYGEIVISKSSGVDSTLAAWMPTKMADDNAPMKTQVDVLFQYELTFCRAWFMKFCLDPSKRFLALGFADGRILIMDLHSSSDPTELRITYLHGKSERQGLIREICFSPDGKFLISVCDNAKVFKYNVKSCVSKQTIMQCKPTIENKL